MKFDWSIVLLLFMNCRRTGSDSDLRVFDENKIREFEGQLIDLSHVEYQRTVSRLGKIAFYIRLFRRFARSPNVGPVDFAHFFPKPEVGFHKRLFEQCHEKLPKCVDFIFENLQSRAAFLFPVRKQHIDDFKISATNFHRLLTSSMFQFDISIAQLFCYFAKNRLNILQQLPFCAYKLFDNVSNTTWPNDRFKDQKQRVELMASEFEVIEPIDDLSQWPLFECAELSFCPNPCCGFDPIGSACSHSLCKNAGPLMKCRISRELNSDLIGMVANEWNVSCDCDQPGHEFRFDLEECVDVDECTDGNRCSQEYEQCVNTVGSFRCECELGYERNKQSGRCGPIKIERFKLVGHGETNEAIRCGLKFILFSLRKLSIRVRIKSVM
ncbi:Epidermal growth factor-like domain and EGF-like calcium-binding domain-containing protein [Aphelenchoides besseyi]|nr:Epidermal growth factor-like domain and EGF-like calcium-binding domain-containing protein [Aphelenchoides besseyi]